MRIAWCGHHLREPRATTLQTYRDSEYDVHAACPPENDAQIKGRLRDQCSLQESQGIHGSSGTNVHLQEDPAWRLVKSAPGEAQGRDPGAQTESPAWRRHGDTDWLFAG